CSVLKRLFFMSVLVVDGLYSFTWYGSAGAGQFGGWTGSRAGVDFPRPPQWMHPNARQEDPADPRASNDRRMQAVATGCRGFKGDSPRSQYRHKAFR
ncbi:hypothetical protein, partial [Xanthomonas campestris]|uniref:hypothetical protein n=1 Tax=Xanthomonas campestris TaxID=339 RepID=UPI003D6FC8B4